MTEILHIENAGSGTPLVMLHGWGMHGGMFAPLTSSLTDSHQVITIDLPGHGYSRAFARFAELPVHAELLLETLRDAGVKRFVLLGWSLGGLLAQYIAAHYPQNVRKLVLIAATPCFVQRSDWTAGIASDTLRHFSGELLADYPATLGRFLALQFFGAQDQREHLRQARELVFARPSPKPESLLQGLVLLEHIDLRESSASIACPALLLNGERDTLVAASAARYLAEHLPRGRTVLIKGAGHAPFLSHPRIFNEHLQRFLQHD